MTAPRRAPPAGRQLGLAFAELSALAAALGVKAITDLPGCWEHSVDGRWWIAINAHDEKIKCSHGAEVPPFNCYIEFNGWPAGLITPLDGGVIAAGEAANEDTFIEAARAATRLAGGEPVESEDGP